MYNGWWERPSSPIELIDESRLMEGIDSDRLLCVKEYNKWLLGSVISIDKSLERKSHKPNG